MDPPVAGKGRKRERVPRSGVGFLFKYGACEKKRDTIFTIKKRIVCNMFAMLERGNGPDECYLRRCMMGSGVALQRTQVFLLVSCVY